MKKFSSLITICFVLLFMSLIISDPVPCKEGAIKGLLLCGRVIIPSLFPFTVCVLFLIKSNILSILRPITKVTNKILGMSGELFGITLLSFIGGYPVGGKLLNEAVVMKKLTPKKAGVMLNFCINAGPAFIISAVGDLLFNSRKIGVILFVSHLTASLMLCILSRRFLKLETEEKLSETVSLNPSDNFVLSVSGAASSMISICSFVILFSCINSYLLPLCKNSPFLTVLCGMLETTNALTLTKNIYLVAFFLGFSGICVWFQVFSACEKIKINLFSFISCRFLHGSFNFIFTYILIKIFKISVPTISNNKIFSRELLYSTPALSVSMLIMGIVFVVALTTRKYNCKLLEDIV